MWVCIEHKFQEIIVHGLFCCNDCAIKFAEEHQFRECSFHEVRHSECTEEIGHA